MNPFTLSDEEVICTWMEPKPRQAAMGATHRSPRSWWWYGFDAEWNLRKLTLNELHEVEARLTDEQWVHYVAGVLLGSYDDLTGSHKRLLHADAPTRIKALAAVLRSEVEGQ